jgi:hypothetical protein
MDELVQLPPIPKRWEAAVLMFIGKLMDDDEKPFLYCCKCFVDTPNGECTYCGKRMCEKCIGNLLACCSEMQASIERDYGKTD